jgi:putative transposase
MISEQHALSEIPSAQRKPVPETLDHYFTTNQDRNEAICIAYQSGGYTLKEIGDHCALHYSTVSGIVNHHKSKTCCFLCL